MAGDIGDSRAVSNTIKYASRFEGRREKVTPDLRRWVAFHVQAPKRDALASFLLSNRITKLLKTGRLAPSQKRMFNTECTFQKRWHVRNAMTDSHQPDGSRVVLEL